jgi:hypothetical protein
MKKYSNVILYAILLCAALMMVGCSDVLAPPDGLKKGGLRINVSSGQAASRTLFPTANFTKYVLSFSGPASHADVSLTGKETSVTVSDLAAGAWTVTAVGYVMINGTEYAAAQGSGNVNVVSGTFQSLDLTIRASMEGANGFFTYSVNFPPTRVNRAELCIYPFGGSEWYGDYRNLFDDPSGSISLAPGYYMMIIRLSNNYQTAGHTEVVYICSNMETEANYTFTDTDFTDTITIGGTVDVTVNAAPTDTWIYVYLDENYNNYLAGSWVDVTNKTWSMTMVAFDAETPLYFRVQTNYNNIWFSKEIGSQVTAYNVSQTNIDLGAVNFSTITLSGTVDVKVNGAALQEAYVNIYGDGNWWSIQVDLANGTWSLMLEPFVAATTLNFRVEAYISGNQYSKDTGISITAKDQDIPNIDLGTVNFNFITLSGTVDVTCGGNPVSEIIISTRGQWGNEFVSTTLYSPGANEPWSIILPPFDTPTDITFRVWGFSFQTEIFTEYFENRAPGVTNHDISGIDFNLGDYPSPFNAIPLEENTWVDGNITVPYAVDWYSVNVTAGTTYYFRWNDRLNGDGSQTADIYVRVFDSSSGSWWGDYGSAWDYPVPFTFDSSGTVYIRVSGLDGNDGIGTYQLMYSTSYSTSGPVDEPVIITQPVSSKVALGDPMPTLSVEAVSPDSGMLSYQWYQAADMTDFNGVAIGGATGTSYTPTNSTAAIANYYYYYVKVTNTKGADTKSVNSRIARINVYDPNIVIVYEDIELVKSTHPNWSATDGGLVFETGASGFPGYAVLPEGVLLIPSDFDITQYLRVDLVYTAYNAGGLVTTWTNNGQYGTDIGIRLIAGATSQDWGNNASSAPNVADGFATTTWNINEAWSTMDFSNGQGNVSLVAFNKANSGANIITKFVIKSVLLKVDDIPRLPILDPATEPLTVKLEYSDGSNTPLLTATPAQYDGMSVKFVDLPADFGVRGRYNRVTFKVECFSDAAGTTPVASGNNLFSGFFVRPWGGFTAEETPAYNTSGRLQTFNGGVAAASADGQTVTLNDGNFKYYNPQGFRVERSGAAGGIESIKIVEVKFWYAP